MVCKKAVSKRLCKESSFCKQSEEADQTGQMPRLICHHCAQMQLCRFCYRTAQIVVPAPVRVRAGQWVRKYKYMNMKLHVLVF